MVEVVDGGREALLDVVDPLDRCLLCTQLALLMAPLPLLMLVAVDALRADVGESPSDEALEIADTEGTYVAFAIGA